MLHIIHMWYYVNCSPDGSSATTQSPITQVPAATSGPSVVTATAGSTGSSVATGEQLGIYNIHSSFYSNVGASYARGDEFKSRFSVSYVHFFFIVC